jgi:DNA polymerase-1
VAQPQKIFLIDTMALIFRSYYALRPTGLRSKDGTPTWAVYATALFLNKLIQEEKPDYLLCVSESDEPTFRHEIYPEYKGTRDATPDDLTQQFPLIFELFEKLRIPMLQHSKAEADDVIGTLAKKLASNECHVYIVSNDKDFMQLVNDHVSMYIAKKGEVTEVLGEEGVHAKFQCKPSQVIDCLGLIGDSVDNVPGVPGIGEKTAGKLISEYGSLEGVYENIDKIKGKLQQNLIANRDLAFLSKRLVTIDTDLKFPFDLKDYAYSWDPGNKELYDFYQRLDFRSLMSKMGKIEKKSAGMPAPAEQRPAKSLSAKEARSLHQKASETGKLSFMVVDGGEDIIAARAKSVIVSINGIDAAELSLGNTDDKAALQAIFGDSKILKIGHGIKRSIQILENTDVIFAEPYFDTEMADYLLDANYSNHGLESCLERHLGISGVNPYGSSAPVYIYYLYSDLCRKLEKFQLRNVIDTIEHPLVRVLADIEKTGIFVDDQFLARYSTELDGQLKELEQKIYELAGETFNINSPKQLQYILFEKLNLYETLGVKKVKKTKTGLSTDESVLEKLAGHPIPHAILEYRSLAKLKSTYVDTLPQCINPATGRVHTRLNQTVAATGRLSSDKPNLQNIPRYTERGKEVRKAFRVQYPDHSMISADYSQIEIRLVAYLANSSTLISAFENGLDIHRVTAAKIFGLPIDKVDDQSRSRAKAVNFGIIYGMGPQKLAADTGVSSTLAKDFVQRYFETFPEVKEYLRSLIKSARETGYTRTMLGRLRPVLGLDDSNKGIVARAENIAVNAPLQGLAADIIKLAMIQIHQRFTGQKLGCKMILQIHDELLFECPNHELEIVGPLIKDTMERVIFDKIPLKVNITFGKNWFDVH